MQLAKNLFIFAIGFLTFNPLVLGKIPEPGNIIYGTVTIGNQQMTAVDSDISISLRRNGLEIVTYFMGQNAAANDNYILKVPIDITGEPDPKSVKPGDQVDLYVGNQLAKSIIILERGSDINENLVVEKLCESVVDGELLNADVYQGQNNCGNVTDNFLISAGTTVNWNGVGNLSGSIRIDEGGKLIINNSGGQISGSIILQGGELVIEGNTDVNNLTIVQDSFIQLAQYYELDVQGILDLQLNHFLRLKQLGTLKVSGVFELTGVLIPGIATVDLSGATLNLANHLDMTGAVFKTDVNTTIKLFSDVTITTDSGFTIKNLVLNNHALTLGSSNTDLVIQQPLVLNTINEQIHSNGADLTFNGKVTMINGMITSSNGTVTFNAGAELLDGILNITDSSLVVNGEYIVSEQVMVITSDTTTSKPVADIAAPASVQGGTFVTLDGSASVDPDGDITLYQWSQLSGTTVALFDTDKKISGFDAPYVAAAGEMLTFQLRVSDNHGFSDTETVSIEILGGNTKSLVIVKAGNGSGSVYKDQTTLVCGTDCANTIKIYPENASISLTAVPDSGSVFTGWNGDCTGLGTCTLELIQDKQVIAEFSKTTLLTQSDISENNIDPANGPFLVTSSLTIAEGKTLEIPKGTEIYFAEGLYLNVYGNLRVTGNQISPVVLTALDHSSPWGGIKFRGSGNTENLINYLTISFADAAISFDGSNSNSLTINHSVFSDNNSAIKNFIGYIVKTDRSEFNNNQIGLANSGNIEVSNSKFTGNVIAISKGTGIVTESSLTQNDTAVITTPRGFVLENNHIAQNNIGLQVVSPETSTWVTLRVENNNIIDNVTYNVSNNQSQDIDMPNNWWGSDGTADISLKIYDKSDDPAAGTLNINPFLLESVAVTHGGHLVKRGDLDDDGQLTGSDVAMFSQCVEHMYQTSDLGLEESQVDQLLGITFATDCATIGNLNDEPKINGEDIRRLSNCITYHQLIDDFGATPTEANSQLGINYVTDCQSVLNEDWKD